MALPSQPSLPSDSAVWVSRLRELAVDDGGAWVASLAAVRIVAAEFGRTRREVELAAVEARVLPWRHKRNLGTAGWEGLARLMRSTAAVVGLGGLGGYVVEGLARMGVGRLILMDGDVFAEHNLNRQLFATENDIGRSKAEVARERVAAVNSAVDVTLYDTFATAETLPAWLEGADVVVDCTDQLPIRITLQDAAARAGIPMVHGAIAGYIGQVMTIMPGDEGLRALYGSGAVPERGLEVELGNPAATPMMIAAWEVQETVKVLLGTGRPLCRRMLFMDAEAGTVDVIDLGCE
jgi:molybdopterin/thiamine biosynthesis adenylyltransferase